jgi:bifunctional UDP-N-acetylglucosamine pyrophosphorylase/glucosamine-1-phosphate N-acetyltransferase
VPPGALGVSAGPQRNIEGWTLRKRAGTAQADAVSASEDADRAPTPPEGSEA